MRVSTNFYDWEIVRNERFPDMETPFEDLAPRLVANGTRMLYSSMQPIRDELGSTRVLSFYRGLALNTAVDGTKSSSHLGALGVDFLPTEISQDEAWEKMRAGIPGLTYDHLNFYPDLVVPTFHVDHRPLEAGPPRMKVYVNWERIDGEG